MTQANRSQVVIALILVFLGLYLFAVQVVPAFGILAITENNWPLLIVAVGAAFLIAAVVTWTPGLMVPATIIGGIGALMFWQNATGNWASWTYAWTLFPGLAGIGTFLMFAMQGNLRQGIVAGGWPILVSLVLFTIFGSFFGGLALVGQYWPLLLIGVGVLLLAGSFWRRAA